MELCPPISRCEGVATDLDMPARILFSSSGDSQIPQIPDGGAENSHWRPDDEGGGIVYRSSSR
jgi:hypothetical protein